MKRLAIQICGHLRTFEKTYKSFYKNIILPNTKQGYKIDIFMHVWDEIEYTAVQWHNENIPNIRGKKLTENQISFLKNNYKPVKLEITPQLMIDDSTTFPEFTGGRTAYKTMKNVWYTKYRVNELRIEYEQENNIKYDYVLNTRPAILYRTPWSLDNNLNVYNNLLKKYETTENKLFYSGHHRGYPILEEKLLAASDIFYFGTPDVLNKVSSIYNTLDKKELKDHFMSWEQYLIYTAKKHKIKPVEISYQENKDWQILRLNTRKKIRILKIHTGHLYCEITFFNFKFKIGMF